VPRTATPTDHVSETRHRLTLVPTPIGNLQDITLRALEVLRRADVIAAEDTRHSATLLHHHGIHTPTVRLDAHTIEQRAPKLLRDHAHVALISDAGTPGISDPGAELVRLALAQGVEVDVLPGPTAFVPALVLSGLPIARFTFEGFLPRKGRDRRERIQAIATREHTTVFYESPRRLLATLVELAAALGGGRTASVSRELSKRFETTKRGTLQALVDHHREHPARGEVVVVVGPADGQAPSPAHAHDAHEAMALRLAEEGLWGRDLRAALEAAGVKRPQAYALAERLKRKNQRSDTASD
jgi:16S rRNA (cytidine1402-2'-O)-methyltransferase